MTEGVRYKDTRRGDHDPFQAGDPPGFDTNWALVIGIDYDEDDWLRLTTPVNDAERLAGLLEEQHGYRVIRLVDGVTKERLESTFQSLQQQVGTDDRLEGRLDKQPGALVPNAPQFHQMP